MPEPVFQKLAQADPALVVDPEMLASIGSAAKPRAVYPTIVTPPDSMPGEVGALASIKAMRGTWFDGVAYDERMRERYGEVYRSMYLAQPIIVVNAPDEIQKILRNEQQVWSCATAWDYLFFDGLNREGGNPGSLLTMDFDAHRSMRKLMQPAFSSSAIAGYIGTVQPLFEANIGRWITAGQVDIKPALEASFPFISNRLLTGIEDEAQLLRFDRALRAISFGGQALVSERYRFLSPIFIQARRAYGYLTDFFVSRACQRRAQPGVDLFSQISQVAGGQSELSDHAAVRSFITMMLGAHDSTALALINTCYLLAKHPEWQTRLREEALAVTRLDWAGLQKLEQLDWVWKESLRLIPVTPYVPRRALRDVEIRGHHVKAGSLVAPMAGVAGRDPDWWTHPLRFDPERFASNRAEHKRHPAIFSPFGGGAHVCIGMQLATLEAKVFFHRLLTQCRIQLTRDYPAKHGWRPLGRVSGKVGLQLIPLR
jgi:cytochrome P450